MQTTYIDAVKGIKIKKIASGCKRLGLGCVAIATGIGSIGGSLSLKFFETQSPLVLTITFLGRLAGSAFGILLAIIGATYAFCGVKTVARGLKDFAG